MRRMSPNMCRPPLSRLLDPLDENFPPPLYYRLQSSGYDVERISILGQRRIKDLKFGASRQRGHCFP
jgi:hypothetical protein